LRRTDSKLLDTADLLSVASLCPVDETDELETDASLACALINSTTRRRRIRRHLALARLDGLVKYL